MLKRFFYLQILCIVALLVLLLTGMHSPISTLMLTAGLVALWLFGAIFEPSSLLLSALALAGTTSAFSAIHFDAIPFSVNGLLVAALGASSAIAIALHFRQQFSSRQHILRWLRDGVPLFALLIWAVFRTVNAPDISNAISDILIWASIAIIYTLARAYWIAHPSHLKDGEKFLLYLAILPLGAIVLDALLGNVFFNNTSSSISLGIHTTLGVRLVPSFFGLLLVPLLVRLRATGETKLRDHWLILGLVVVLSAWIYFSLSRLIFILLLALIYPQTLAMPRTFWKAAVISIAGAVIAAIIVVSPLYPRPTFVALDDIARAPEQLDSPRNQENADELDSPTFEINRDTLRALSLGRTGVWEYLLKTWADSNPIFGLGTGASRTHVKDVSPSWDNPHSDYIRVLFDLGIVGLLVFVITWVNKALNHWRRWTRSQANIQAALRNFTACLALCFVLFSFLTDNFLVYFFIMAPFVILLAIADAQNMCEDVGDKRCMEAHQHGVE